MTPARRNNVINRINCGIAINETTLPRVQEKIMAVNRSRIDFAIIML